MARIVEDEVEQIRNGKRPPKHWGSKEYQYKKDVLRRRKLARIRKRKARSK